MSCMHQTDSSLISKTGIKGNATIVNQCDEEKQLQFNTPNGVAEMIFTKSRGLTKSRNIAIRASKGDICLLCDDDEVLVQEYEEIILNAYNKHSDADVIAFDLYNHECSLEKKIQQLKFPKIMKICSCQITFKRDSIVNNNIIFDELLGAGTGNGAEEELKFLKDCLKAKLKIIYVPIKIAEVSTEKSTWFSGFDEAFFENRGASTRYILGLFMSSVYAVYYVLRKRNLYIPQISTIKALKSIFKGIFLNKISKQALK